MRNKNPNFVQRRLPVHWSNQGYQGPKKVQRSPLYKESYPAALVETTGSIITFANEVGAITKPDQPQTFHLPEVSQVTSYSDMQMGRLLFSVSLLETN